MVTVKEAAIKALTAFIDDIVFIQENARCSDQYFRGHVISAVKNPQLKEAVTEAKEALAEAEKPKETPKRSRLAKYDE